MKEVLLFLVTCSTFAQNEEKLDCTNLQSLDENSRSAALSALGLSPTPLEDNTYHPVNYRKEYAYVTSHAKKEIQIFKYNVTDNIIATQFEFHRTILPKLRLTLFPGYIFHCVVDEHSSYLFSNSISTGEVSEPTTSGSLGPVRRIGLNLLQKLRTLEQNSAVLVTYDSGALDFSFSGTLELEPSLIASIYREGELAYAEKSSLPFFLGAEAEELPALENYASFVVVLADRMLNRYALLDIVEIISEIFKSGNIQVVKVEELELLSNQISELLGSFQIGEEITCDWDVLEELLETGNETYKITELSESNVS